MKRLLLGILYLSVSVSFLLGVFILVDSLWLATLAGSLLAAVVGVLVYLTFSGIDLIKEYLSDREFKKTAKKVMKRHSKALKRLKD